MRLGSILLTIAVLGGATATASTIEVSAPVAGATLRGGSTAGLAWSADLLPGKVEEWEAFLSIDGGVHYAFRITPHLNASLRSVTWLVPNVDADDARLLIRVGDERKERSFVIPLSFAIVRDPGVLLLHIPATGRGEAAREGDDPVVVWAEGDRGATRVVQVTNVDPPAAMLSLHPIREVEEESALDSKYLYIAAPTAETSTKTIERPARFIAPALHSPNVLLSCGRLNI